MRNVAGSSCWALGFVRRSALAATRPASPPAQGTDARRTMRSTPSPSSSTVRCARTSRWMSAPRRPARSGATTIRLKLADGWSEQQIKDYFVEQYGARVLATPPAEGLNWLVYILPPVAFLAGAFLLFRALRSWRHAAAAAPSAAGRADVER